MNRSPPDPRAQAKRAALNALRRARRAALRAGVALSDWEGEFLGSVEDRVETFGRAFGDPEKGPAGAALSVRQRTKLKEIVAKTRERATAKSRSAVGDAPGADETIERGALRR